MSERERVIRRVKGSRLLKERRALAAKFAGLALFVITITWVTMWSVNEFNEYRSNWYIQNECIADLISQGFERRDINRHLDGCTITIVR
jgi:hypothetical protein